MNKTTALKIVNGLLYLTSTCLFSTGLILEYRLEGKRLRGAELLGMTKHTWTEVHFILGISTAVLVLAHLYLNWGWITKVASGGVRSRILGTVGVAVLLIATALLAPATFPQGAPPSDEQSAPSAPASQRQQR